MLGKQQRETPPKRNKVFISYSRNDNAWLEKLHTYLRPYERDGKLSIWDDTRINPGAKWKDEIQQALASANVAVLLVSADFLASDFIVNDELPPLLTAAEKDGATILWFLVSACPYQDSPISQYQSILNPKNPLDSLSPADQSKALTSITNTIKEVVAYPK